MYAISPFNYHRHIQEHLDDVAKVNVSEMSAEEKKFHNFK